MHKKRVDALQVALVAVIAAAERRGVEPDQLLEHAADLLVLFLDTGSVGKALIASARTEIREAHVRFLTSRQETSS